MKKLHLDHKDLERLEAKLQASIGETIMHLGLKRLPLLPSDFTLQMMAKSAAAVYEAAVDSHAPGERP